MVGLRNLKSFGWTFGRVNFDLFLVSQFRWMKALLLICFLRSQIFYILLVVQATYAWVCVWYPQITEYDIDNTTESSSFTGSHLH